MIQQNLITNGLKASQGLKTSTRIKVYYYYYYISIWRSPKVLLLSLWGENPNQISKKFDQQITSTKFTVSTMTSQSSTHQLFKKSKQMKFLLKIFNFGKFCLIFWQRVIKLRYLQEIVKSNHSRKWPHSIGIDIWKLKTHFFIEDAEHPFAFKQNSIFLVWNRNVVTPRPHLQLSNILSKNSIFHFCLKTLKLKF